jgi:hypothetical protein
MMIFWYLGSCVAAILLIAILAILCLAMVAWRSQQAAAALCQLGDGGSCWCGDVVKLRRCDYPPCVYLRKFVDRYHG